MDGEALEFVLMQMAAAQSQRFARWVPASYRLVGLLPDPGMFVSDAQQVGRLDCYLRELERDQLRLLNASEPKLAMDFHALMSRCWISLAYEILRAINRREGRRKKENIGLPPALHAVFRQLEMVRMPEFKREIARARSVSEDLYLKGFDHQIAPEPYLHERTVLNVPRGIDPATGSLVWFVYEVEARRTIEVRRQELGEAMLLAIEAL